MYALFPSYLLPYVVCYTFTTICLRLIDVSRYPDVTHGVCVYLVHKGMILMWIIYLIVVKKKPKQMFYCHDTDHLEITITTVWSNPVRLPFNLKVSHSVKCQTTLARTNSGALKLNNSEWVLKVTYKDLTFHSKRQAEFEVRQFVGIFWGYIHTSFCYTTSDYYEMYVIIIPSFYVYRARIWIRK